MSKGQDRPCQLGLQHRQFDHTGADSDSLTGAPRCASEQARAERQTASGVTFFANGAIAISPCTQRVKTIIVRGASKLLYPYLDEIPSTRLIRSTVPEDGAVGLRRRDRQRSRVALPVPELLPTTHRVHA